MKKLVLLVALFLVGTATQTLANQETEYGIHPGKHYRYTNANTIRFIENGVLYNVRTDGTFTYQEVGRSYRDGSRGRKNFQHCAVTTDRYGRIRTIGTTFVTYKRNNKVRSIGEVPLYYHRGSLVQVGNMKLYYNRFGTIRKVKGHVNKQNKRFWHDDWYSYNKKHNNRRYSAWDGDDDDDDDYSRRIKR